VDYLITRDDIDPKKIAYSGVSWGSYLGINFLALEDRFRTCILAMVGLDKRHEAKQFPAWDNFNFAPRVRIPVLLINGKYDSWFLHEATQVPLYRHLGTPEKDKKFLVFPTGHSLYGYRGERIKATLDWLDKYLGPVQKR